MQPRASLGWVGVCGAGMVWALSVLALTWAMGHQEQVSSLFGAHPAGARPAATSSFDLPMILGCTAFTVLQLASMLLFAFVFRASWRLRAALCFSLAAGLVIAGDAAGLLALLVWLGVSLGAS